MNYSAIQHGMRFKSFIDLKSLNGKTFPKNMEFMVIAKHSDPDDLNKRRFMIRLQPYCLQFRKYGFILVSLERLNDPDIFEYVKPKQRRKNSGML